VPIRNSEREIGLARNAARCPVPAVSAFMDFAAGMIAEKK
jgi:hypothetical protein